MCGARGMAPYIGVCPRLATMGTLDLPEPRIYLDHAATTSIFPDARAAMIEVLETWHNPSSPYAEGRAAKAALEGARERIRSALGWTGKLVFTSGASEAVSIALTRVNARRARILAVEHDALHRARPEAERIPVDENGLAVLDDLRPGDLVAIQHVNNETGVIQPVSELAARVREAGGILLSDCAQSAGKIGLPDADMIAISAHKFGGPPGVGALLLREYALISATGGQEQGYRGGTENLPAIAGMAAALDHGEAWMERAGDLRRRLELRIEAGGGEVIGRNSPRIPTIGAYRMPGIASNTQLVRFDLGGVAVSAGSACSSGSLKPSHVLASMGYDERAASEVIRVSLGPSTTGDEVDRFADLWCAIATGRKAA